MTNMTKIEEKFEVLKNAATDLGDVQDIVALKENATPELKGIATACKNLPAAQKTAVLATLNPDDKKTVELLSKAADMPQDTYNQLRTAYFSLVDELEAFRKENGKFKRPFTRGKKKSTTITDTENKTN